MLRPWQWKIGGCVVFIEALLAGISQSSLAQIVPDNTLGLERSSVTSITIQGIESDRIDHGAIRGANLFHSFEQFNIGVGRGAYFSSPTGIENIFSRVTGANRSDILGRLGVLGSANLFLINPKGIVFGADSSLDVKGSFLATTANAIRLGDTGLFSASQPATSNLLSVSPSAFWFNAVAASSIVNRSQAQSLQNSDNTIVGLEVQPDRTLALVGGDVLIEGGSLTAPGGRIELGSVAGAGQVSLTESGNRFRLGYDSMQNVGTLQSSFRFGLISLSNQALIDTSGEGGGDVQIRAGRLEMAQRSNIWADTLGAGNGGQVLIRTTEMDLSERSLISANVLNTATGTGGDLTIDTGRLTVRGGARVSASTFGEGKGGSLRITASDSVELVGISESPNGLFAQSESGGSAGNLTIDTRRLIVRDGALVSTSTIGEGKSGDLQITADSIEVMGTTADRERASVLSAQSIGTGNAGNLTINTGRLVVRDGAQVTAGTFETGKSGSLQITADSIEVIGQSIDGRISSGLFTQSDKSGDAGELKIGTGRLIVRDGARVSAGTYGTGKGGTLQITADSVEVMGRSSDNELPSALLTESQGSGDAGNLGIDTGHLVVRDGARVSSRSTQEGTAGNINITARDTLRADDGTISTSTSRSAGGAITIKAGTIRLFGNSDIRSEVALGANNGGAITLTANSILAFNDSDILAFARTGRGGNITLNTPAFFGENYRPASRETNLSSLNGNDRVDINATGAISGIITIPDVSFIQNSLTELPGNLTNTDTLLANSCIVRRNQPTRGRFTIAGTGGLPQRPGESQTSSFPTVDVETPPTDSASSPNRAWQKGDPIVEPQGLYRLPNGKLVLSRSCND